MNNRKRNITIAKIMIAFSLILIIYGVSYSFSSNKVAISNTSNTDNTEVTVTTTNTDNTQVSNTDNSGSTDNTTTVTTPTPSTTPTVTTKPTTSTNTSTTTNTNSGGSSTTKADTNTGGTTPVVNDPINDLRVSIQNTYGISVKYGSETDGYTASNITAVSLGDSDSETLALNDLKNALELYPNGLFQEIRNGGISLSVYLVKGYNQDNVTGLTEYNKRKGAAIISIALDYPFNDSFFHESYHFMEDYIELKGGAYTTWNNLNPSTFTYGTTDLTLSYANTGSADSYFVNSYAETNEDEDRASTFEYMMADSKASCLNTNEHVWLKAKYMCEQIDYFLNTVSPSVTEYWERFVY
jgi:hypothetical protein